MTKNFDAVIRRYAQKYGISFRDAASMLGKRGARAKQAKLPKKKLTQGEFNLGKEEPTYGSGI